MKKIVRILGLIQLIRQKKHYSSSIRHQLIRTLLLLEYKSYRNQQSAKPVKIRILQFKVHAYGYVNLCLLFREIFVHEEYQYFSPTDISPLIVDCGANIGMATIYLKWKFPNAAIYSFEPDPSAFTILEKNVKENNLQQVYLYNKAAMPQRGELDFFVSEQTKASLMMSTVQGRMDEQKITVQGIDFPSFINEQKPSLLKIDIEGAEKKVFAKMNDAGAFCHLTEIIMEYHHKINNEKSDFSEMLALLEKNGFEYNLITQFERAGQFQDILIYAYRT